MNDAIVPTEIAGTPKPYFTRLAIVIRPTTPDLHVEIVA